MTFDLSRDDGHIEKRRLLANVCEMPRTDDRYQGRPYQHGFVIVNRGMDGSSGIGHVDVNTGELEIWAPGPGDGVQEAQFVPRTPDSAEGDGWLIVPVSRVSKMRSDLVILDARNIAAGPVATLKLPVRVRATFHGTWVPEAALRCGRFNYRRRNN
jgi:carotenoid cleavage dioxygenase